MAMQVCLGASMQCSFGLAPSSLVVLQLIHRERRRSGPVPWADLESHARGGHRERVQMVQRIQCPCDQHVEHAASPGSGLVMQFPHLVPCRLIYFPGHIQVLFRLKAFQGGRSLRAQNPIHRTAVEPKVLQPSLTPVFDSTGLRLPSFRFQMKPG